MGALMDAFLSIKYVPMLAGFRVQAVPELYREECERECGRLLRGRIREQCAFKGEFQDELRLTFERSGMTRSASGSVSFADIKSVRY